MHLERGKRPPMSASHLAEIKDIPESDRMTKYLSTCNGITNGDINKLMRESGTSMAVRDVTMTATRDDHLGGMAEYNGLLVYHEENTTTSLHDQPVFGWIIASTPRTVSLGIFMPLLFCK